MQLRHLAAFLGLVLPLAGCRSDEALNAPDLSNNGGLLQRYVSMGNSITAGFQSAGINDSTQLQSYAVLFAAQAKAPFFEPLLSRPGCPAPFDINSINPPHRLGGGGGTDLRAPGADAAPLREQRGRARRDVLRDRSNTSPFGGTNALTQFILGGRTQVKAMMDADPTFVSVWIGNNDVLGSLTSSSNPGNPALVTPEPAFEANYGPILDSIQKVGAKAVLLGVADVALTPYASSGATYWCIKNQPALRFHDTRTVPARTSRSRSIARPRLPSRPRTATRSSCHGPWGYRRSLPRPRGRPRTGHDRGLLARQRGRCCPPSTPNLRNAVKGFNTYIQAQAQQRGWAYVDVNPNSRRTGPTRPRSPRSRHFRPARASPTCSSAATSRSTECIRAPRSTGSSRTR